MWLLWSNASFVNHQLWGFEIVKMALHVFMIKRITMKESFAIGLKGE